MMNERIKKLAEQSGFYFYDMHDVDGQDLGESIEADNWAAAEKFAELIVRECMGIISDESEKVSDEWRCKDGKHIWWKIKEHFGVEE